MTGVTPEIARMREESGRAFDEKKIIGFPAAPIRNEIAAEERFIQPTLKDYPFGNEELGKPFGDINGIDKSYAPTPPVNDLAPYVDKVNPPHYKQHGIECIELTENMGFLDGNIVKYVYRYAMKGGIDDLDKADWYLQKLRAKVRGTNDADC